MNTPDNEPGDELANEYRRASDANAGSPAAATRAAILAEARAAALRRTPAANDSRYVWRAAAGIAVLGVAVILWRQANHNVAPDLTVAAPESAAATQSVATTTSVAAEPQQAADAAKAQTRAKASADTGGAGVIAGNSAIPAAPTASVKDEKEAAAAPPPNLQLARASAEAAAPIQAAGAIRKDGPDYQQLLQREFPEVWDGTEPPHTVWVVVDANGKVLRKGELSPGATVTPDTPFESQRPWQMVKVTTASGSSLQLAVMSIN